MAVKKQKKAHPIVRAAKTVHRHAKDHFIPHQGNNYTPHVLKHRVLFGYSVALVLLKAIVIAVSIALPSTSVFSSAITQGNIVNLTNEARKSLDLNPVAANVRLTRAAQAKAEDMLTNQYFAHTSPSGTTPWVWIRNAGYAYSVSGENLAVHYTNAEQTFSGWLASPGHRANIVNPKFTEIGVGVAEGIFEGYPSVIVVQMFARPKDTAAPPSNPEPVTTAIATTTRPTAPVIKTASAKMTPTPNGMTLEIPIEHASSAVAQLGNERIRLEPTETADVWKAELPVAAASAASPSGDVLSITAWDDRGSDAGEIIATISPSASTQDMFISTAKTITPSYRLFGIIPLDGLRDNARQVYLTTMVALAALLAISMLVKIEIQRPTVIAHAVVVMCLSAILFIL